MGRTHKLDGAARVCTVIEEGVALNFNALQAENPDRAAIAKYEVLLRHCVLRLDDGFNWHVFF